jgi:hypothetical protein
MAPANRVLKPAGAVRAPSGACDRLDSAGRHGFIVIDATLDEFLARVRPGAAPTVVALDAAIRAAAPLDSTIRWRQLLYGLEGDFHHWICAVAVSKSRVTLNFHFGALLADHEGVFRSGSSRFMRLLDFETPGDVDVELIGRRITDALSRLEYFKANWKRIQQED